MSDAAATLATLKDAYRQWADSKGATSDVWMKLMDDNIDFGSIPRGEAPLAFAKDYSHKDQLRSYFDGVKSDWTMVYYRMDEFVVQNDIIVVRGTMSWTSKKTGTTFDSPKLDYWRFRDGKAVEYYEYFDTARAAAAAT